MRPWYVCEFGTRRQRNKAAEMGKYLEKVRSINPRDLRRRHRSRILPSERCPSRLVWN